MTSILYFSSEYFHHPYNVDWNSVYTDSLHTDSSAESKPRPLPTDTPAPIGPWVKEEGKSRASNEIIYGLLTAAVPMEVDRRVTSSSAMLPEYQSYLPALPTELYTSTSAAAMSARPYTVQVEGQSLTNL